MKKVAILQSNYIPWKGYFDMINMVDEFVLYDTAQYTKNDWRNRNKIKTPDSAMWLTIPVKQEKFDQKINNTTTIDNRWRKKHWNSIKTYYSKAAHFKQYSELFEQLYLQPEEIYLSKINYQFISEINKLLGCKTKISWSSDYEMKGEKTEKLMHICKQLGATEYISGPAAKVYFDEEVFEQENIRVSWMDYSGYREYGQLHAPYEHRVSILDLIFNEGENATAFLKSFNHGD